MMEFSGNKCSSACFVLSGLLLLCFYEQVSGSSSPLCYKRTFADMAALREDQCSLRGCEEDGDAITSRVLQIDGHTVEKALSRFQSGSNAYAAVLFYAEWCPFSSIMRQMFDSLSASFPVIHHLAVESSALWPSALSQHGVHSLPTLFVYNKTSKVRFHGSRTLEAIGQFYMERTGFLPANLSCIDGGILLESPKSKEMSWSKWFRMWLHANMYLAFTAVFLMSRLLYYLMPKFFVSIRYYWSLKETSHKGLLRRGKLVDVEQRQNNRSFSEKSKGKSSRKEEMKEAGKGVLSVPGWSSSSLAAVTLAESSSRGVATEDARENGHAFRSHLWG